MCHIAKPRLENKNPDELVCTINQCCTHDTRIETAQEANTSYIYTGDIGIADANGRRLGYAAVAALAERYVQYGHTVLRIVEKTARFNVRLVSRLPVELQVRLGFLPTTAPGSVLERWREEAPGEVVGLMPGPPVYPVLP